MPAKYDSISADEPPVATTPSRIPFLCSCAIVLVTTSIACLEPLLVGQCESPPITATSSVHANPDYNINCPTGERRVELLGLSRRECSFARRIAAAGTFGGIVGWERGQADRHPHRRSVRTFALIAVGACLFTLTSVFAFVDGPMAWDASRVAAAIPSGVGFLGAALTWKKSEAGEVHGLTTAASTWVAAALGVAAGGGMHFAAMYTVAAMLVVLRCFKNSPHDDVASGREAAFSE